MKLSTPSDSIRSFDLLSAVSPAPIRARHRRGRGVASVLAGLVILGAGGGAAATPVIQAVAGVGQTLNPVGTIYAPTAVWTPPNGALVSTSIQRAWADSVSIGDTYSLSAAAQSSISGVDHWTGYVQVGGYMHHSFYNINGAGATAQAFVFDDILIPSTATWSGAGFLALTFHLTGSSSIGYTYVGPPDPTGQNVASADVGFTCNTNLAACDAVGIDTVSKGFFRDTLGPAESFDQLVTLFLPVRSDIAGWMQLNSFLSAGVHLAGASTPTFFDGGATADFSHTFQLVDADLLDSGYEPVADWSIVASSGFDYAHLAAVGDPAPPAGTVPEPGTFALLGIGFAGVCVGSRRAARRSIVETD